MSTTPVPSYNLGSPLQVTQYVSYSTKYLVAGDGNLRFARSYTCPMQVLKKSFIVTIEFA